MEFIALIFTFDKNSIPNGEKIACDPILRTAECGQDPSRISTSGRSANGRLNCSYAITNPRFWTAFATDTNDRIGGTYTREEEPRPGQYMEKTVFIEKEKYKFVQQAMNVEVPFTPEERKTENAVNSGGRKGLRSTLLGAASSALLVALSGLPIDAVQAATDYPNKPVTVVVPSPPGGIIDASTRLVTGVLAETLAQPFIVENRGGGSGNLAYSKVARSAPDGYTLLASYSGFHVGNPLLTPTLPWSQSDLKPVALIATSTNVITVHPSVPANTLAELISYAKTNPGQLSYASQGYGSVAHIGTEIFKLRTGTEILHIPYRGSGPALQDLLGNQVHMFVTTPPSVGGHIQLGKLRALAVTGETRYPELPDVPTTAEAGLDDYELETWVALFAPADTPDDIVEKLTTQVKLALENPETIAGARAAGFDARYESPAELSRRVSVEHDSWSKAVREGGIKAE